MADVGRICWLLSKDCAGKSMYEEYQDCEIQLVRALHRESLYSGVTAAVNSIRDTRDSSVSDLGPSSSCQEARRGPRARTFRRKSSLTPGVCKSYNPARFIAYRIEPQTTQWFVGEIRATNQHAPRHCQP